MKRIKKILRGRERMKALSILHDSHKMTFTVSRKTRKRSFEHKKRGKKRERNVESDALKKFSEFRATILETID